MIPVSEVYDAVTKDEANIDENGQIKFSAYNRMSKKAELRLLEYLTSDVENIKPPMMFTSQKDKDWLSFLITPFPMQVSKGFITRPTDYYAYDSLALLGNYANKNDCNDEDKLAGGNTVIELLNTNQFDERGSTYIEDLKPSFIKPIVKMVGNKFEFMPKDLGSIELSYIRYPKYASIVTKVDTKFNQEVIDIDNSSNYEWNDFALELLVYFIVNQFTINTREQALSQANRVVGKLIRDEK